MQRLSLSSLVLWLAAAVAVPRAAAQFPLIPSGDPIGLRGAAISASGTAGAIYFAATARPDGTPDGGSNLYRWSPGPGSSAATTRLTNYLSDSQRVGVFNFAYPGMGDRLAYTTVGPNAGSPEEVHVLQLGSGTDKTIVKDSAGCIQLALLCVNCFTSCLRTVHLTDDGGTVFYSAARDNPFYVVGADGTGGKRLDIYQGTIAASTQRVISQSGRVVFTSAAPFGPTFAADSTNVYSMKLDGSDVRQLTRFGLAGPNASDAVISKNGSVIAFVRTEISGAGSQIWIVNGDGTGLGQLSGGNSSASSPSVSDDGTLVTFIQDGNAQIANTGPVRLRQLPVPRAISKLLFTDPQSAALSGDGSQTAIVVGPLQGSAAAVYRAPTSATTTLAQMIPVYTPRMIFSNSVGSATGYSAASAGSLFSLFGANLIQSEGTAAAAPLPLTMGGNSLLVDGKAVPLQIITPWQVNAQLPQSAQAGTSTFQLRFADGAASTTIAGMVKAQSPDDFVVLGKGPFGSEAVSAAFHPGTGIRTDFANPASAGEILEIYTLGLGRTQPSVDPGLPSPVSPLAWAVTQPRLQIGGRDADLSFWGLVPGLAGVYQINAKVPSGLRPGANALTWIGADGSILSHSGIYVK